MAGRVRLRFAGVEVEFVDRDVAVAWLEEVAERGTGLPVVIYGPEGCGKTALLRQAALLLEEHGYHVVYVDPLAERLEERIYHSPSIRGVVREALSMLPDPYSRIAEAAVDIAAYLMRRLSRPRLALLADDVFQAIGVERAEAYVKMLLNLVEHPPGDYERIVVLVASSEGVSRRRIGRHMWALTLSMWNMGRAGFEALYGRLPGQKPGFEEAWRWAGGNPRMLEQLYVSGWDVDVVVGMMVEAKGLEELVKRLSVEELRVLKEAVNDPDVLFEAYPETERLVEELVEKNLVVRLGSRNPSLWVDEPPPERDEELGIGRRYAWQTPIHREAVRRLLGRSPSI